MKITLCLLTYNEIDGCKLDVPYIDVNAFDEIYAIDGGSKDGTIEYLEKQKVPVHIQPKKGLNSACNYAVEKCTTDAIIFFHPKGSIDVSETLKFRKLFEEGYELIVASRMIKGAQNEEDGKIIKYRKWFVLSLGLISRILWKREGNKILDVLHGFRGATVKAYKLISPVDYGLSIDIEMVSRAYKKRIKRIEFPIIEKGRSSGETHFKALPTGAKLLKYMYSELFRKD